MNVMPVAQFLKDFSDVPLSAPVGPSPEELAEERAAAVEAARAEGHEAGREEGLTEARAEAEARLAEQEQDFAQRLAEARATWVASEGAQLAASIGKALTHIHDEIIAVTAEVLKPFLVEAVRKQALAELSRTVEDILKREPEAGIAISGPEDLIRSLEVALSEHAGAMTFTPSQTMEIEVKAGHALLSTRIAAWVEKINEATR
ncbi:MAG: hypothetical protein NW223_05670 [Hyphomicrobiaceae bacterium]|nr:hypothetical protein [Hyphomicrobiaceae bacterium]